MQRQLTTKWIVSHKGHKLHYLTWKGRRDYTLCYIFLIENLKGLFNVLFSHMIPIKSTCWIMHLVVDLCSKRSLIVDDLLVSLTPFSFIMFVSRTISDEIWYNIKVRLRFWSLFPNNGHDSSIVVGSNCADNCIREF